jgi:hypothetical protein
VHGDDELLIVATASTKTHNVATGQADDDGECMPATPESNHVVADDDHSNNDNGDVHIDRVPPLDDDDAHARGGDINTLDVRMRRQRLDALAAKRVLSSPVKRAALLRSPHAAPVETSPAKSAGVLTIAATPLEAADEAATTKTTEPARPHDDEDDNAGVIDLRTQTQQQQRAPAVSRVLHHAADTSPLKPVALPVYSDVLACDWHADDAGRFVVDRARRSGPGYQR